MTVALSLKLWKTPEDLPAEHNIVEVLYDVEKVSIEWCILELSDSFRYRDNIKEIEIINYWDGDEVQSRIAARSTAIRDESARSNLRVVSEYHNLEESDKKSFQRR